MGDLPDGVSWRLATKPVGLDPGVYEALRAALILNYSECKEMPPLQTGHEWIITAFGKVCEFCSLEYKGRWKVPQCAESMAVRERKAEIERLFPPKPARKRTRRTRRLPELY